MSHDDEPLTLLGRRLPPWASVRVVALAPGARQPFDPGDWVDALVVVEVGELALEGASGRRCHFETGSVLWLADLPLAALCNEGDVTTLLVAVARGETVSGA